MVRLLHSYGRLREIAKDLGFNAARLLRTHSLDFDSSHRLRGAMQDYGRPFRPHLT